MESEYGYAALAGGLLSLFFAYFPYVKDKFETLRPDYKQLIQIGVIAVLVFGQVGLSCVGRNDNFTCDTNGLWKAAETFIFALIGNVGAYKATNYIGKAKKS